MLRLTHWALQQRRPALVTHLLVDADDAPPASASASASGGGGGGGAGLPRWCHLLPVSSVYLGRALLGADGADLQDLARGGRLAFASARYCHAAAAAAAAAAATPGSAAAVAQMAEFLCKCGARRTVALAAFTRDVGPAELTAYMGGKVTPPPPPSPPQ